MGKKIRKGIGVLLIAIAIAVTQIPVSDVEAVDSASASDFQMNGDILVKYNGTAADVSVSNYVKKIETGAFAGNTSIEKVTIGSGVESIGSSAFEGCTQLQSVTIPDSVKTIDQAAFAGCPALQTVEIGTGLQSLGNGVFAGDDSLENVKISSSNEKFTCDNGAIYNKNGWDTLYAVLAGRKDKSYAMPSSVTKIKPYAFWGDRKLESVSLGSNVKDISAYAFSNCSNLKEVNIPYSVNTISMKAFEDCIRLRNITIPISVNTIHSTAFDGCTKLSIQAEEGSVAKAFADNLVLEDIDISEYEDASADTINGTEPDAAPQDGEEGMPVQEEVTGTVDYYHEVTHMNPLETEEDDSVKGKTRIVGNQAFVFVDNASATVISGEPDPELLAGIVSGDTGETIASISGNRGGKGGSFPKYTIIDDAIVANQAYYSDERTSIEIPDTITGIGDFAFARSQITSTAIPEGVTRIGYAAFYHCDGLTDVVIPDTVTEIAPSAFDKTPWLQNWEQGGAGDFLIVGDGILLAYKGSNAIVTIPDSVKTIGAGAFADHSEINKVVIPASVETVGEGAFAGCGGLSEVEGGNGVRQIKDRAYQGCAIQNITIPASVEEIGLLAFDMAYSVKAAKDGTVTFEGTSLPGISYEASSGKLYNDAYRGLAFNGIEKAIVPEQVKEFADTVLDENLSGFRGKIYTGKAKAEGKLIADTSQTELETDPADPGQAGITVYVSGSSIPDAALSGALMEGVEKQYELTITDSEQAKEEISAVYRKLYGNNIPGNLLGYEMTLQETDSSIPITGLGRQAMEITIPMPQGIGKENLHVVCLDANGQLEETESRIASVDGMEYLVFMASHFSAYGIYNYVSGNTAAIHDGQAVFTSVSGRKDASPDTGDFGIHPKWFLGCGLFFTGLAVFFYRGKRRRI